MKLTQGQGSEMTFWWWLWFSLKNKSWLTSLVGFWHLHPCALIPLQRFLVAVLWSLERGQITVRKRTFPAELEGEFSACRLSLLNTALSPPFLRATAEKGANGAHFSKDLMCVCACARACVCMCVHACVPMHTCLSTLCVQMPVEGRRGARVPWN